MTAFYYDGLCYATPADALPAFVSSFPKIDTTYITYLSAAPVPSITAAGVISFNATRKNLSSTATTNVASTLRLPECLRPDVPYDYSIGGAFWAFGFVGVMVMYFSAHAIGLVLQAVRKL